MGACSFYDMGLGKTASEAFGTAVRQARYDYGHAGYTGTLAEKDDYMLVIRPNRVTALEVINTIDQAYWGSPSINVSYLEDDKTKKRGKDAYSKLVKWFGDEAENIISTYNDKWGPCIAIEASQAESAKYKERMGVGVHVSWANGVRTVTKKRVHGRVYVFAGWASS